MGRSGGGRSAMGIAVFCYSMARKLAPIGSKLDTAVAASAAGGASWPLPNVWEGASVEHQAAAEDRIPDLLATPAALHWISAEPLIGPIDLTRIGTYRGEPLSALEEVVGHVERPRIAWVVAGCESGRNARACSIDWLRSLRDQCAATRVPFFLKQAVGFVGAIGEREGLTQIKGPSPRMPMLELPELDGQVHAQIPGRHLVMNTGTSGDITPTKWGCP